MVDTERKAEQQHLDVLYARLDELRVRASGRWTGAPAAAAGTPPARSERDAFAGLYAGRLAQLRSVEERLCFGRLDLRGGERRYIGRLGLSDDERHEQLLVDWRAPAARAVLPGHRGAPGRRGPAPAPAAPSGRAVTGIDDEVLDLDADDADRDGPDAGRRGRADGGARRARTGRMRDIVATIQAEQDRVIRSAAAGVLVVQGGPGTGKTAVALHRAAYLLYTHREQLAAARRAGRRPEPDVPALHRAGAAVARRDRRRAASRSGGSYPGVDAAPDDDPEVAAVKGDLRMAERAAPARSGDRQRVPAAPVALASAARPAALRPPATSRRRADRAPGAPASRTTRPAGRRSSRDGCSATLAAQLAAAPAVDRWPRSGADLLGRAARARDVRRELTAAGRR